MNLEQRETFRMTVLNFLAPRHVAAFNRNQIADRLRVERRVDFPFTIEDVTESCLLLCKMGLAIAVSDSLFGVVAHYQATGSGVIESEKWRAARGME